MGGAPDPLTVTTKARRNAMERLATMLSPPADVLHESVTIAGIACEWVRVADSRDDHVIVWAHGGGFSAGNCYTHRGMAGEIARHAKARVLTVDYRLSPEHVFPAAHDDMTAVYSAVAALPDIAKLGVGSDSAGGALALSLLQLARDSGLRQADAAVFFSPWLDLRCTANAYDSKAAVDCMIHPDILRRLAVEYLGQTAADDPSASPVLGSLSALPPLLLQVGSDEVLIDDTLLLDRCARAAGVDVTLEVWPEMLHVFQAFYAMLPEAHSALEQSGRFFRKKWNAA